MGAKLARRVGNRACSALSAWAKPVPGNDRGSRGAVAHADRESPAILATLRSLVRGARVSAKLGQSGRDDAGAAQPQA